MTRPQSSRSNAVKTDMTIDALMPVYARSDVEPTRGDGAYLFDRTGRRWLDFASGVAVNTLGHAHPHLVRAIHRQAQDLMHTSNLYGSPFQRAIADRLVAATFADTVFFCNSGAEAVECAIKTARRSRWAAGRPGDRIITFGQAFHGRSITTVSSTLQERLCQGFGPLTPGFTVLPYNDLDAVTASLSAGDVAAVLIEPVQGEGGLRVADPAFIKGLRAACDATQTLLIFDEVQTGVGRTGRFFAYEHYGVTPDIMAVAKGLGGGFPVGACLATAQAAQAMTPGAHGSTYGGNPMAMAACGAVLDVVLEPGFLDHVRDVGDYLYERLEAVVRDHGDLVEETRGRGLMRGLKLKMESRPFVEHLRAFGLLTVAAGDNVVRFLPPLIVTREHIEEGDRMLRAALGAYRARRSQSPDARVA